MKSQFNRKLSALMLMTLTPFLMFSATPLQAGDRTAACENAPATYRSGAPGKGTINKHDCERVEFAAFELKSAIQQETGFEDKGIVNVGKPGYNRHPRNH